MKVAIGTLSCVVALLCVAPPVVHAAPQSQTAAVRSDQSIQTAVAERLERDAMLKSFGIRVAVNGGVATLTGTVRTDMQRTRAAEVAKAAGASRVDNDINVSNTARTKGTAGKLEDKAKAGTEKTQETAEKATDTVKTTTEKAWQKTKDGWETVVDKTTDIAKRAGAEITDAFITTSIKTKFVGEDALKGSDIIVDTDKHVVTLMGTVPTEAGRDRAIDIVKHTDGVDRIVDHLTIAPKKH